MKKIIRILAVIVVICLTCTCLSGCNVIEELREQYAYYDENGNIIYNEKTYKELPKCDNINFEYSEDSISVSEKEVPLLFNFFIGDYADIDKSGTLIEMTELTYFCREDKYDSIVEKIENGFEIVKYSYEYDEYDEEEIFGFGETKKYQLSAEEIGAVQDVSENVAPIAQVGDDFVYNCDYVIYVLGYSEDGLFYEDSFDILVKKDEYYIELKDEYYNPIVRKVPEKYNKLFEKMTKTYIENYDELW